MYPLEHCFEAMYVLTASGSVRSVCLAKCLSRLAVPLIVVSSYASLFIQSITFIMLGDAVEIVGDDDAVPDRPLCGYEELMTDRPL